MFFFRERKVQLLALLPTRYTVNQIHNEYNVSKRLAKEAKNLQDDNDSLDTSEKQKPGRQALDASIAERVTQFYESEENSRQLPGKKDFKSVVQEDGTRKCIQKKLILCNISELYESYKQTYPHDKISFSKFALLRPKHCVLAGSSGTHNVCVCLYHENVNLMLEG